MRGDLAEIGFVMDRSGSMSSLESDAVGGYNSFVWEQQKAPGEARFSLVLFNHTYRLEHNGVAIGSVPPLTRDKYQPAGFTALNDAVGRTIDELGTRLAGLGEPERPGKVIIVILTDGMENASSDYSTAKVGAMIEHQQRHYGWEFIFLGANQDAFKEAAKIGIVKTANVKNFVMTPESLKRTYADTSSLVTLYRSEN